MTDCVSFVVMRDHGLPNALTAERDFQQASFPNTLSEGVDQTVASVRQPFLAKPRYPTSYGLDWTPCPLPFGELGLLHLLATDVQAARAVLERSGRRALCAGKLSLVAGFAEDNVSVRKRGKSGTGRWNP